MQTQEGWPQSPVFNHKAWWSSLCFWAFGGRISFLFCLIWGLAWNREHCTSVLTGSPTSVAPCHSSADALRDTCQSPTSFPPAWGTCHSICHLLHSFSFHLKACPSPLSTTDFSIHLITCTSCLRIILTLASPLSPTFSYYMIWYIPSPE